jgi:non-heme chloroperoxidase
MPYLDDPTRPALFYRDWGAGDPVLFCSAWSLSSAEFQYQMLHLVEHGLRAISYDRRGHGRSEDPGRGYDYDTLADDLAALIERLDLRELILVGHSMGGGEITRYLTRHGQQRVRGVVLLAAALPAVSKSDTNPHGVERERFDQVRDSWRRDYGGWLDDSQGPYFGDGLPGCEVSQFTRNWTMNDMLSTSLQAVFDTNQAIIEADFTDELAALSVPTLIIHGDHDASIPLEISGVRQHQLLADSHLIVYENAPHGLYLTHTDRLNDDLVAFVNGGLTVGEHAAAAAATR